MGVLIGAILAILSLAVILVPFVRARPGRGLAHTTQSLEELLERRQHVYQEMQALQLDYQLGNMEEEEYRTLMRGRRLEAAALLRRQKEEEQKLEGLSQEMEEAILAFRKSAAHYDEVADCPQCNTPLLSPTTSCPHCGASLHIKASPHPGDSNQ